MVAPLNLLLSLSGFLFFAAMFWAGLSSHPVVHQVVSVFIDVYLLLVVMRTIMFFFGAFREKLNQLQMDSMAQHKFEKPMVSIIVPCYNEEDVIELSLGSLMKIEYPNLEIIVIDDGSRDGTYFKAMHLSQLAGDDRVKVYSQNNAGKAAALNHGLNRATGDLIMCVDADSKLSANSIEAGVRHFVDRQVGAVAGFITIGNQHNILLKLQQLEYLVGLNFTRRALSCVNLVPIVPGPAGLFRREAIYDVGGFHTDKDLFAEDAELTLRLLAKGWKIKSEEKMVATTEAPESTMALLRQRYRWNRGTYQALFRNLRNLYQNLGYRGLSLCAYLWTEIVVTPTLNFGLILYFFGHFARTGEIAMFSQWYLYLLAIDLMTTVLATYTYGQLWRWVYLTFVNKFYFYYMLLTWKIFCLHEEWHQQSMEWDKLERTGRMEST